MTMDKNTREIIESLLANPDGLLQKKPFYRGLTTRPNIGGNNIIAKTTPLTGKVQAQLPSIRLETVTQGDFMRELDVFSHRVLFDENVPAITIKAADNNGYLEIEQYRMSVPFQVLIRDKQVRHLCVIPMQQTLLNSNPTEIQSENFVRIKQAWEQKNMEGAKTKFVQDQKSYGDAGLLFYMDGNGKVNTRNINFADGYVIITHKDNNGKHILECLYYSVTDDNGNTVTYIDCYDDEYMTRFTDEPSVDVVTGAITSSWRRYPSIKHGFSENPLITKRGEVAWNRGQKTIESYEALYNTFIVIQKRHGWGLIYVKGKFNQNAQKIAGQVVLNDTSLDPNADAKVLSPPDPNNMIETLDLMEQTIMKACGTTFVLPKDIKISGDTSGLAVELTQELDLATAQDGVIDWQNVANKMMRLFVEGLAMELVNTKENEKAITEFADLRIQNKFMVWKPKSEQAHNQMLATLKGAGGISQQTLVEKNTISTPDEMMRIEREHQKELQEQTEIAQQATQNANTTSEETIVTETV